MNSWQVVVEREGDQYVTYVPALDFASSYGPTRAIALERTREMIAGYLEAAAIAGDRVAPPSTSAELVEIIA